MNYKFGVVIVTFNRKLLLNECIECVLNQSRRFDEIIIVDNCSTDGTGEYLDSIKSVSNIKVIHASDNLGGAGGFHLGVGASYKDVDYLLLIDDDAMLNRDFLKEIERNIVNGICAYSGTVTTNGKIDFTHRRRILNKVLLTHKDVACSDYNLRTFDYELSTFCGLMVSSKIIEKIGLPKREYFIWYDDSEYSLRINKYSKIRNVNTSIINHKTTLAPSTELGWKSYYGYRNKIDMGKNYSSLPFVFVLYRYLYHIIRCLQYFILSLIDIKKRDYYKFASKLMIDIIKDSFAGKLGKNEKYQPLKKLY